MKLPKGVLFDFGGTLFTADLRSHESAVKEVLKSVDNPQKIGVSEFIDKQKQLHKYVKENDPNCVLDYTLSMQLNFLFEYFGMTPFFPLPVMESIYCKAGYTEKPIEGMIEFLDILDSKNIPYGIVSNVPSVKETLKAQIKKFDLLERFKFVIASAEIGLKKPAPFIFELALKKIGLPAEDVLFFGDNYVCDIVGASNVGIKGVLLDFDNKHDDKNVYKIHSWKEFINDIDD